MSRGAGRGGFAAAKVNLCLHVGPCGADGYHPIASLMVFADVGDHLSLEGSGLRVAGRFAGGLSAGADNLIARARSAFEAATGATASGVALEKGLPIGAGLGGGSADAAATLRLLNAQAGGLLARDALNRIAGDLGADVTACLESTPAIAQGRGERLSPAPAMPALDAVLIYPGAPSSTPAVYAAFDDIAPTGRDLALATGDLADLDAVLAFLAETRNDLQAPAVALEPAIGEALAWLAGEPETLFARMTGSGSAVFALCRDSEAAERLSARSSAAHPAWWVRAARLGAAQTK